MSIRRNNVRLMGIDAGQRDRRITIEQWSTPDQLDSEGAPNLEAGWTTLVECMPAARYEHTAEERLLAGQTRAVFETRWVINYRLDMDPELIDVPKRRRIVVGDRTHEIIAAAQIERRRGIELLTVASSKVPTDD